jgi:cell division transport system permease protein
MGGLFHMAKTSYQKDSLHYPPLTFFFLSHVRALIYGFGQIWRRPAGNLMTIFVLAIALALPGSFFSFAHGIKQMLPPWQKAADMTVYLKDGMNGASINQLQKTIGHMQGVGKTKIITPAQGLQELSKQLPIFNVMSQLPSNPLPTVIDVAPSQQTKSLQQLQNLDQMIAKLPGVDIVQLAYQWVQQVMHLTKVLSRVAIVVGIIFALAIMLMISNTIRLTLQKDKQDIQVFRFLGASRATILRPLLYQGLWLGILAGVLAMIIMVIIGLCMIHPLNDLLQTFQIQLSATIFFNGGILMLVLAISVVLSWLGTRLSVQRAVSGPESNLEF